LIVAYRLKFLHSNKANKKNNYVALIEIFSVQSHLTCKKDTNAKIAGRKAITNHKEQRNELSYFSYDNV
jgi:hypothetical protein